MPNTKISALTALTGANLDTNDLFAVVDTSAVTTKSITTAELKLGIMPAPGPIGGTTPSTGAFTSVSASGEITSAGGMVISRNDDGDVVWGTSGGRSIIRGNKNAQTITSYTNSALRTVVSNTGLAVTGTLSATTGAAVGGATAGTGGLAFPATSVEVADANTLDDFEEGTWTPTLTGTSTAGTGTYTAQTGTYTKIGRVVKFKCYLSWSAHTGTGNMTVTTLPFTSSAGSNTYSAVTVYVDTTLALTASNVAQGIINPSAAGVTLSQYPSGGGSAVAIPMDTAAGIVISGYYEV